MTLKSKVLLLILAITASPALATQRQAQEQLQDLVNTCAPDVHPNTMFKILGHESGFNPYIIGVNERDKPRQVFRLSSQTEAAQKADELIAQGKSIDMGLGQIWSGNLARLKLSTRDVFDPCKNIATAAKILLEAYERAEAQGYTGTEAMDQALSLYNTGKFNNGIRNGYVQRVRGQRYRVPALDGDAAQAAEPPAAAVAVQAQPMAPPPAWDVFANAQYRGPAAPQEAADNAPNEKPSTATPVMLFGEPT